MAKGKEEIQKKIRIISETTVVPPTYAPFVQVHANPDGIFLKFFYIPPSGPENMKLAASIFMRHHHAAGLAEALKNILQKAAAGQTKPKTSTKATN